jgi:hypothetical protein
LMRPLKLAWHLGHRGGNSRDPDVVVSAAHEHGYIGVWCFKKGWCAGFHDETGIPRKDQIREDA